MIGKKDFAPHETLILSPLAHTWIIDLDGTLLRHNGYKNGGDSWLDGALDFLRGIPQEDYVLLLTAREKDAKKQTVEFLKKHGVRYNRILFGIPMGERILINDTKPSGLYCAYAVRPARDVGLRNVNIVIDPDL